MKIQMGAPASHEQACARVAARFQSRLLRHYAANKMRSDPVYPAVYKLMSASPEPLLDVGCGVGLLGFYLRERGFQNPIIGLDRDARKIRQAKQIAGASYEALEFQGADVRKSLPPFSGNVALLDVLHYLPGANQKALLAHLAECVTGGAALVLRDCPRDGTARFWVTCLAEKFAQGISWNIAAPLYFPTRESIRENFPAGRFAENTTSLWGRTPFNNYLFIFRRHARAIAPAAE